MGRVMRGVYYAERGLSGTFTTSKTRPRADTGRPCESPFAHLLVSSAPAALAAGAAGAAAAPARVALLVLRVSVLLFFRHRARFEGARVRSVERARRRMRAAAGEMRALGGTRFCLFAHTRPYAHFSPKSVWGSHHVFIRYCTRFGADEADEENINRKTMGFPYPSSCSNFPNSNVLVDTMTPPNVGVKSASCQIFRRSGFRQILCWVRTRQVVSIPRDDKGNYQHVFVTAKNLDPPANKDRISACLA